MRSAFRVCSLVPILLAGTLLASSDQKNTGDESRATATPTPQANGQTVSDDTMRFEGEKRYSANCGRCHQAPHKLPRRAMATAIRHMRVRAILTEEDMRYILWYMTR